MAVCSEKATNRPQERVSKFDFSSSIMKQKGLNLLKGYIFLVHTIKKLEIWFPIHLPRGAKGHPKNLILEKKEIFNI